MSWVVPAIVAGALAAAINAGAFFVFSNFVMPALADLPPAEGAAAMQSINRFAPNPMFMLALFGAPLIGVPVLVADWGERSGAEFRWVAVAVFTSMLTVVVTAACNVPRNDALAALDVASPSTASYWFDYVTTWTRWNTVRTVTSVVSVGAWAMALRGR